MPTTIMKYGKLDLVIKIFFNVVFLFAVLFDWKQILKKSLILAIMIKLTNELYYGYEKYTTYYNNERIQKKIKRMPPVKYQEASICA